MIYKLTKTAPAPNKAPMPTAPVAIGMAPALLLDEVALAAPPLIDEVEVVTPEVNGTSETLDAPEKAGAPVLAVGEAEDVAFGLSTLSPSTACRR
jgi:hypothetical protein